MPNARLDALTADVWALVDRFGRTRQDWLFVGPGMGGNDTAAAHDLELFNRHPDLGNGPFTLVKLCRTTPSPDAKP